jgi:NADH-quinone oxidoreductase subunit L
MSGPLATPSTASVLAGAVLGIGPRLVGREGETLLEEWLAPSLRDAHAPFGADSAAIEWGVILAAYVAALAAWALARSRYHGREADWVERERRAPLFQVSTAAFGVDAIYTRTVVPLVRALSELLADIDRRVVDGLVHFAALATRATGWIVGRVDDDVVDGAVRALSEGTLHAGERLRRAQTGRIQSYVYAIAAGVLAVAFLQYWLR